MEKMAQKMSPIVTDRAVTSGTPVSSGTTGTYFSPGSSGRRAFSGSPVISSAGLWLISSPLRSVVDPHPQDPSAESAARQRKPAQVRKRMHVPDIWSMRTTVPPPLASESG